MRLSGPKQRTTMCDLPPKNNYAVMRIPSMKRSIFSAGNRYLCRAIKFPNDSGFVVIFLFREAVPTVPYFQDCVCPNIGNDGGLIIHPTGSTLEISIRGMRNGI